MNKVILPDGINIVMDEDIFNQNPNFFMKFLIGSLTISRITNQEADRLEQTFNRDFVKDILAKETYSWNDFQTILETCI